MAKLQERLQRIEERRAKEHQKAEERKARIAARDQPVADEDNSSSQEERSSRELEVDEDKSALPRRTSSLDGSVAAAAANCNDVADGALAESDPDWVREYGRGKKAAENEQAAAVGFQSVRNKKKEAGAPSQLKTQLPKIKKIPRKSKQGTEAAAAAAAAGDAAALIEQDVTKRLAETTAGSSSSRQQKRIFEQQQGRLTKGTGDSQPTDYRCHHLMSRDATSELSSDEELINTRRELVKDPEERETVGGESFAEEQARMEREMLENTQEHDARAAGGPGSAAVVEQYRKTSAAAERRLADIQARFFISA